MLPRGVKLEQNKKLSLQSPISELPAPENVAPPAMFAPIRKKAPASRILLAARMADIRDERDGVPLERKLSGKKPDLLVAVCFDDDPFTSASEAVLHEQPAAVEEGLSLAARACGATERKIAVVSRKEAARLSTELAAEGVLIAGSRYPAGTLLLHRLSRDGKKVMLVGVQALVALADAKRGRSQSETVVTVAGDGFRRWGNWRVRIGTPLRAVLEAGEPEDSVSAVVIGSSVRGQAVGDLSLPVESGTRCVIALKKVPGDLAYPCIGCSRCERACPYGVIPWMVLRELGLESPDVSRMYHVQSCDGCAACSAVCPSFIDLVSEMKRAAGLKGGAASL